MNSEGAQIDHGSAAQKTRTRTGQTGARTTPPSIALPSLLRKFWAWSAVVFALTLMVGWLKHRMGYTGPNYNPLTFPFFGDLMEYPGTYKWLHTEIFFNNRQPNPIPYPLYAPVAYPPFCAVVLAGLYAAASPVTRFLELTAAWLAVVVWGVRRALVRVGTDGVTATLFPLTLVLISFPIARLVVEGNVELAVWILTAAGVWAYLRAGDDAAATLWGLAAAMKLFPMVLLVLLLPRRHWRAFTLGVATFAAATTLSLWWLGPTMEVAWRGSLRNVFGYQSLRGSEWSMRELVANHSTFMLVKLGATIAHVPPDGLTLTYYACGAVVMGCAFFGRLWKMPVANQLLAVSVFMVMFPPISYFHTLVHLYAPLLALLFFAIRAERSGVSVSGLRGTVMLFVPLFAAYTVLTFPRMVLFGGLVQAVLLIMLFGCALRFPFALSEARDGS